MKKNVITGIVLLIFLPVVFAQTIQEEPVVTAPEKYRKPADYKLSDYRYSLHDLKKNFSEELMNKSAFEFQRMEKVNNEGKWKPEIASIDSHVAPEWFLDAKFGMFVDWGLWSVAGWAPKREKGAMYPDWYELRHSTVPAFVKYHEKNWGKDFRRDDFIPLFTAADYKPGKLAEIARKAGMKYMVPFCKHHSGFCLWPSSYTHRDVSDMGPGKDLMGPLVDECRRKGLKFGFYYSHEEWESPVLDENGDIIMRIWGEKKKPYSPEMEKKCTGKIAVRNYVTDYMIPQAVEFIDRYDPDILWYDGDWNTNVDSLRTYDLSAYFYNHAEGRKEVAVNDRYGGHTGEKWQRSKRGDFFTNEYGDMEKEVKKAIHPWEECRGISQSFGFNWQDTGENVITSNQFIDMFVDIVAHGGNLLLVVNLDGGGALPEVQENRLKDIGKWLKTNGEGIYATRHYQPQTEGNVAFTKSKDGKFVFAIMKEWPGNSICLKSIQPARGSRIEMLGFRKPLEWSETSGGIEIKLPPKLQDQNRRPCDYAWVLKIAQD